MTEFATTYSPKRFTPGTLVRISVEHYVYTAPDSFGFVIRSEWDHDHLCWTYLIDWYAITNADGWERGKKVVNKWLPNDDFWIMHKHLDAIELPPELVDLPDKLRFVQTVMRLRAAV